MIAYVICCNDSVQACVLDNKLRAVVLQGELVEVRHAKDLKFYGGQTSLFKMNEGRKRWHIETVEVTP